MLTPANVLERQIPRLATYDPDTAAVLSRTIRRLPDDRLTPEWCTHAAMLTRTACEAYALAATSDFPQLRRPSVQVYRSDMTTLVRVYHNVHEDHYFLGYCPDHLLIEVAQIQTLAFDTDTDTDFLEFVFDLFNIGDDPDFGVVHPLAAVYRLRGNRSLSKGDVIAVEDAGLPPRYYACEGSGWRALSLSEEPATECMLLYSAPLSTWIDDNGDDATLDPQ